MQAPEVRYVRASDGARIAYCAVGEGTPNVVFMEPLTSHVQLEWVHPVVGRVGEALSRYNTVVRFDVRGSGLSDRMLPSTTPDWVRDLEAVVAQLKLDTFVLTAIQSACRAAIAFVARHPGKVRRLALIDGFASAREFSETQQVRAIASAAESDWETATEAIGAAVYGSGRAENASHGEYIRECVSRDFFAQFLSTGLDIRSLMAQLAVPTIVIRHKASRIYTGEMARDLAAGIPGARLVEVDGLWPDDIPGVAACVAAFLNDTERPLTGQGGDSRSGVRTLLFTDLVGHTEMMRRLGDERGRAVLREHERITRETLKTHGGDEIKTMGDGFMASFGSATQAMECAIELQRAFARRNASGGEPFSVRVGLNAGEPIEEDGDLFGATVILASRIAAKAGAGEILVTETLRGLLSGKSFLYGDRGEFVPKGFDDAVRVYEVHWRQEQ